MPEMEMHPAKRLFYELLDKEKEGKLTLYRSDLFEALSRASITPSEIENIVGKKLIYSKKLKGTGQPAHYPLDQVHRAYTIVQEKRRLGDSTSWTELLWRVNGLMRDKDGRDSFFTDAAGQAVITWISTYCIRPNSTTAINTSRS